MEKKVNELIEESCVACGRGEMELVRLVCVYDISSFCETYFVFTLGTGESKRSWSERKGIMSATRTDSCDRTNQFGSHLFCKKKKDFNLFELLHQIFC
jgi:hypothetical protein